MDFTELQQFMSSQGIESLAEISRALGTTPQAVSNWKARNQVPHHIVNRLNALKNNVSQKEKDQSQDSSNIIFPKQGENYISITSLFLGIAQNIKVVIIAVMISVFYSFIKVQSIEPLYLSSAKILVPENKDGGSLAGTAAAFGINVPSAPSLDLSSLTLLPEILKSRTFTDRILEKKFYTEKYGEKLTLISILTHGDEPTSIGRDTLLRQAGDKFQGMLSFDAKGSISILTVKTMEPVFSKILNEQILIELEDLYRFFKSRENNEKVNFINQRILFVEGDLQLSELKLKNFREKNRQISSPSLMLEEGKLQRNVNVQSDIYLTLKQQLELAKIEEIQESNLLTILDMPQISFYPYNINKKLALIVGTIMGIGLGIFLALIRFFTQNINFEERKNIRKIKVSLIKKIKDIFKDKRFIIIVILIMIFGLPFFLSYQSSSPQYFNRYSSKIFIFILSYVATLMSFCILLIRLVLIKIKSK